MVPMVVEQAPYAMPCSSLRANRGASPKPDKYSSENATSNTAPPISSRLRPTRSITRPLTRRAMSAPMMKMLAAEPATEADAW